MKLIKYLEFVQADLEPVKSFHIKDELNPKVWDDQTTMNREVREQLLQIANDFYQQTDIDADIKDIILTGSLANYNWSEKYSDYDLHILIDFKDVSDDVELVKKFVDGARKIFNDNYDLKIVGYEVEVYIQDIEEPHTSTGVYSVLNDKWKVKPIKIDFELDEDAVKDKARSVMMRISDLEEEAGEVKHEKFIEKVNKVWEKIKNFRKSGLSEEGGEFSIGNITFKLLRRNGYIGKIMDMKKKSYEKQFN
jgi:hypothetical protein